VVAAEISHQEDEDSGGFGTISQQLECVVETWLLSKLGYTGPEQSSQCFYGSVCSLSHGARGNKGYRLCVIRLFESSANQFLPYVHLSQERI
jgi:hypothetical protein